jgi:hypothetical protein
MTDADVLSAIAADQQSELEPASLDAVKRMGKELVKCEADLAHAEEEVKRLKKLREDLRIKQLPEMFFKLGITMLGGIDGTNCVLRKEPLIQATLSKEPEPREQAINWLVDNKHGGSVKRSLYLDLPKGDAVVEHKVVAALRKVAPSLVPVVEYDVHYQTYLALCKRLVQSGAKIPLDVLGIYVGSIVRMDTE